MYQGNDINNRLQSSVLISVSVMVHFQLFDPTGCLIQRRDFSAFYLPELPKALPLEAVPALAAHYVKK